jgi:hypothetical protein
MRGEGTHVDAIGVWAGNGGTDGGRGVHGPDDEGRGKGRNVSQAVS